MTEEKDKANMDKIESDFCQLIHQELFLSCIKMHTASPDNSTILIRKPLHHLFIFGAVNYIRYLQSPLVVKNKVIERHSKQGGAEIFPQ